MQWYTGNTLYDTLLIIGFAYALLIFVWNSRLRWTFRGWKTRQGHQAGLKVWLGLDGASRSDRIPNRIFHGQ